MKEYIHAGEKRIYAIQHRAVLHRPCNIIEIPPGGELGYTQSNGDIHLAGKHPLIDTLPKEQQAFFRCGVFVHETLHQCYTDFASLEEAVARQKTEQEKEVLSLFINLVEDPAIEYFAPLVFGGYMLEALRFSIRHIYRNAPDLSHCTSAFEQLINALIMFGDMGLLKGEFTYPEAKEAFLKLIPSFNKAVTNPSSKARIRAAEEWLVITRPLWKRCEDLENMMDRLEQSGMRSSDGEDRNNAPSMTPDSNPGKTDASERRSAFSKAVSGTEEKEEENPSGSGNDMENGENKDPKVSRESSEETPESADRVIRRFTDTEEREEAGQEPGNPVLAAFWDDVEAEAKNTDRNEDRNTMDLPVPIPKGDGCGTAVLKVLNKRPEVQQGDDRSYARLLARVNRDIRMLTSAMKDIFRADYEEQIHSTAGKYRIKRDLAHTSVKVFDRKKDRKNTDDLAVMILVDISGSMSGNKIALARSCTVTMAETFAALKIPCYILGFTADTAGAQAVHEHYVTWKNTKEERISLVKIQAQANNDDGYSIRYATQLLKRKPAEHKLLFVLSDGAPACRRYQKTNGIKDTSAAILETRKSGVTIFGIGIGVCSYQELKDMYRGDYINVTDTATLTGTLAKQLKKTIRRF